MMSELSECIKQNIPYVELPSNFQGLCGNCPQKYGDLVLEYNYSNQRKYDGNLVQDYIKKEDKYYINLLEHNCKNLMIYPYHLSAALSKFSHVDPCEYYTCILEMLLSQSKSYDVIPNFTAADILQLLGIGRNQYIDIVVKSRPNKSWLFKKPSYRNYIQRYPNLWPACNYWWMVKVSFVSVDDITNCSPEEKVAIDDIIDMRQLPYNYFRPNVILNLLRKNLIWFDIIVMDTDHFSVPTLENFVMNRVQGDYMETTMYKIFISIDENTAVDELAALLDLDIVIVKNAISLFCRLGLCCRIPNKINNQSNTDDYINVGTVSEINNGGMLDTIGRLSINTDHNEYIDYQQEVDIDNNNTLSSTNLGYIPAHNEGSIRSGSSSNITKVIKRIGLFFDSSLSAFLMMGNLSTGLKSYAVTMYEVGKLTNECMDTFINELSNLKKVNEGDAHVYYLHAINLLHTLKILRKSSNLKLDEIEDDNILETDGIDLLSAESFCSLDSITRLKILQKRYSILISIAPLLPNIMCITTYSPYHFGPYLPEVKTPWYRMFIYTKLNRGPCSLFLPKGYVLTFLPDIFKSVDELMITPYRSETIKIKIDSALITMNNQLKSSSLLVQSYKPLNCSISKLVHIPFPFDINDDNDHKIIQLLKDMTETFNLDLCFGYITMIFIEENIDNLNNSDQPSSSTKNNSSVTNITLNEEYYERSQNVDIMMSGDVITHVETLKDWDGIWIPFDICYGIALFDTNLNRAICEKIKHRKIFRESNLEKYSECSREHSVEFMNFMKNNQAIRGKSPQNDNLNKFDSETLPTYPILFDSINTNKWNDPLIDHHILDYNYN